MTFFIIITPELRCNNLIVFGGRVAGRAGNGEDTDSGGAEGRREESAAGVSVKYRG